MQDPDLATGGPTKMPNPDRGLAPTDLRDPVHGPAAGVTVKPEDLARVVTAIGVKPGQTVTIVDPEQVIDLDQVAPDLAAQLAEARRHPERRVRSGRPKPKPEPAGNTGDSREQDLTAWWHELADGDLKMLIPKAIEYSAHDLRMAGMLLADMLDWPEHERNDTVYAELATGWYLMSKITRMIGAYKEHRLPSTDTLTDARVYATMLARIRDRGGWPGWNEPTAEKDTP